MATKRDFTKTTTEKTSNPAAAIYERMEEKAEAAAIKSERITFLATPEKMKRLNDLVRYYDIIGRKINGHKPTPSKLLNLALDDFLVKHADDLERYDNRDF